jgi:hypothetical protein
MINYCISGGEYKRLKLIKKYIFNNGALFNNYLKLFHLFQIVLKIQRNFYA